MLGTRNEFQACFATSFDLYKMVEANAVSIPWSLHLADLLRVFPSQIVPFKVDPPEWYLQQKDLAGTGVGFAYGLISETVVGLGYPHLVALGFFLAFIFGRIHRYYLSNNQDPLVLIVYVWFCVKAYSFFRISSFCFLGYFVYGVVPFLMVDKLVRRKSKRVAGLGNARAAD